MSSNNTRSGSGMRSRNASARPRQGVASRELQEARRRRRQREVMRNRFIFGVCIAIVFALIIFGIVKLVQVLLVSGRSADTSTITFKENGQVVFEEVTDFDTEVYSPSELKSYTKDLIASFNETYGEDAIHLNKVSVKKDKAYVKTTYKDAQCYATFTSYETYMGSYEDAVAAGYDFSQLYSSVADGTLLEAGTVDAATLFAGSNVICVGQNITVNVPGNITYVSNGDITLEDGDTVTITQADENEDATDLVFIIYTKE